MNSWVLITGATGGLGKAFASECAARGWNLVLTDLKPAPLEALSGGLQKAYEVDVRCYTSDLTNPASRGQLFDTFTGERMRFWMVINVAGLDFEGSFYEQPFEKIRTIIRLNIEGTLEVTHALMQQRDPVRTFRIINVASLAAFYPMPVKAMYAASKRFLLDSRWRWASNYARRRHGDGAVPGGHAHHARMHRVHRGPRLDGQADHPEHRLGRRGYHRQRPQRQSCLHSRHAQPNPAGARRSCACPVNRLDRWRALAAGPRAQKCQAQAGDCHAAVEIEILRVFETLRI